MSRATSGGSLFAAGRKGLLMSALWGSVAASAGAVVTTLVGVVAGAAISKRSQDEHWARDQVARACVRLLEESSLVITGLFEMERARPASVPQGVVVPTTVDWRPWNQALNMINLVADRGIVDAALALDEQIWRMHTVIRRGLRADENWIDLLQPVLDFQGAFINTARRQLARDGAVLDRMTGKPNPDDPIWTR
jgi:hypothetical protein